MEGASPIVCVLSPIPIVIPAYEPDERLLELLEELVGQGMGPIVLVDDGSGEAYAEVFAHASAIISRQGKEGSVLLSHEVNRGKGAALKTAFRHVLDTMPDALGVVTADSDGQHTPSCIARVSGALRANDSALVLGVREFGGDEVPWKSRVGNSITAWVFARITGTHVSDTQTGLRGIPRGLMRECLDLEGDRFEFEMQMLAHVMGKMAVVEVPIATVYDSRENHQTHFNALRDSYRIYRIILREPVLFALCSLGSSAVDLVVFWALCNLTRGLVGYVALSTAVARVLSATLNYLLNARVVFRSKKGVAQTAPRYAVLAFARMALSAGLVTLGTALLPRFAEVGIKVVVDTLLFFVSFVLQKRFVF